ncbi:MAG: iron-sulfur cluster assembly scaffold protein, partial [Solirubrobacterales bacterium]|nr:iron-sulfur cluster assembly scaffold protein [Solirubrobacterales bacterium]
MSALREYLEDGSHRGPEPPGAHSGAAGGSACGDLIRVSLLVAGGSVRVARFEASGCAAAEAAGAAACELAEGESV